MMLSLGTRLGPYEVAARTIALVMELVEAPTLAERIAQGAIPVDEALPIARMPPAAADAADENPRARVHYRACEPELPPPRVSPCSPSSRSRSSFR
jgi:hypothetical protein